MKTVYIINGFLEAGKTEFINFTLAQDYFQSKGTTLIVVCEEGEVDYDPQLLAQTHSVVEYIDDKDTFSSAKLLELEKKHKPERIIIEYNGMWQMSDLKVPWHWKISQQISIFNAETFNMYINNMRSLIGDMVKKSELIIINRCDNVKDLATIKRSMMALNRNAEIVFEDANGEVNATLEEELPFDVNAPVIELNDQTYGIWFFDCLDNQDRYDGKTVKFLATVKIPDGFPKNHFVPGRHVMTCCADDVAYLGFVGKYEGSKNFGSDDWITITAEIKMEYWKDYNGVGPVLYVKDVEEAKKPKEEILNLV